MTKNKKPELYELGIKFSKVADSIREYGLEKTIELYADAIKIRSEVKTYIENVNDIINGPSLNQFMEETAMKEIGNEREK